MVALVTIDCFTVKSYAGRPWLDVMADTGIGDVDHRQRGMVDVYNADAEPRAPGCVTLAAILVQLWRQANPLIPGN